MTSQQHQPSPAPVLTITTITAFMTAFMGSALNVALPIIGKDFEASAVAVSWISTIYLLTTAAILIPVGKLADTYGRTKFFKIGIFLFLTGTLLCGFAAGEVQLLIFRAFQGLGSAMIFSCSTAILVSSYPPNERGKVIGINTAAVYTGLSSGPFLGGLITDYFGWRLIFHSTTVIGIILLILTAVFLKFEWKEPSAGKFDLGGALIQILGILIIMLGISFLPGIYGFVMIPIGILLITWFYFHEQKTINPLLDVSLFKKNRTFTLSNAAALINYSATFAISFLMSFYLQSIKEMTPKEAGIILITQPIVQALFSPLAGRLSDKHEPRLVSSIGMTIITVGLIVFCFLSPSFSFIIIIINLAMLGFGFALFSSPNASAIMGSVEKNFYGVASSTLASMRLIGQMLSMGIVIVIFTVFIGKAQITAANQQNFLTSTHVAFSLFTVLCVVGIFASLARGKIHD